MNNQSKENLMCEVADMYYRKDMTQLEISQKLFISRSSISRLLQAARDSGLVEIKINYSSQRCYYLEDLIKKRYDVDEVFVYDCSNDDPKTRLDTLCKSVAKYLNENISHCSVLGVSRGAVLEKVLDHINDNHDIYPMLKCVQMHGSESASRSSSSSENSLSRLVSIYGGTAYYLNAPMYVNSDSLRRELENEPSIRSTLDVIAQTDMVITGIGALSKDWVNTSFLSKYLDEDTVGQLISANCVGHIFGQFFDIDGKQVNHNINLCRLGVSYDTIRLIPKVVAVVSGKERSSACLGALRGKLASVLFVDRECASSILF